LWDSCTNRPNHWTGSNVHVAEGSIAPQKYVIPQPFADYLNRKAREMEVALGALSRRQEAKAAEPFRRNIERFATPDAFTAMQADVDMFGDEPLGAA
jgi:hypothetical protein